MTFLKRLTLAFHVILGILVFTFLMMFILQKVDLLRLFDVIYVASVEKNIRVILSVFTGMTIIFNYLLFRMLSKSIRGKRDISFDNPAGKVSVSIYALEELAKRVAAGVPEVKDVHSRVTARKKSIDVELKLALSSDTNILEITSRVQNLVRRRIQETISLEQTVNVSAFVSKIDPVTVDSKSIKGTIKNPYSDIHVPFQGYRA